MGIELKVKNDRVNLSTPSIVIREGGSIDLSNYYTKDEVNALIPDVSGFAKQEDLTALSKNLSNNYYTKSEVDAAIPDVSGFTTMSDVEAKGYQTEAQVNALIQAAMPPSGDEVSY